uniref:C-type lectin domain-containing protein n=1 Tax=Hippocampus comes TaxID=109280 RepID=A0A3Q2Z8D4_HIPCM
QQLSQLIFALSTTNPGPQCDLSNGWDRYSSNCYKVKSETAKSWTWAEARADCVNQGGDLVSITDPYEQAFIQVLGSILNSIAFCPTGISLWMGGHDSITEGGWEWTDGSPFRYVRWSAGNPDNYFGEDCLSIIINNGYWNDDNCENRRGYICKRRGKMRCSNSCCTSLQSLGFFCRKDTGTPTPS